MLSQRDTKELTLNKFFTDINESVINSIFKSDNFKEVNEGEVIYRAGENSNELFLLLRGDIKIKFSSHNYISNKIFNDFFGEKELFDKTRRNSFAVANNKCLLYIIQKHIFDTLVAKSKTIKKNIETFGEIKIPEVSSTSKSRIDLTKSIKPRLFRAIYSGEEEEGNTDEKDQKIEEEFSEINDTDNKIEDSSVDLDSEIIIAEDEVEETTTITEDQSESFEEVHSLLAEEQETHKQSDSFDTKRILDALRSINQHFKTYETVQSIVKELRKLTSSKAGEIYLFDKQSAELKKHVDENGIISFVKFDNSEGLTGTCTIQGKTINLDNPMLDSRFVADIDQPGDGTLKKIIYVPLLGNTNETVGVLQLARNNQSYTETDIEILELITKHAALSIERCISIDKLIQMEKQKSKDNIQKFLTENLLIPINVINSYTSHLSKESFSQKIKVMISLIKNQTNFIWDIVQSVFYYDKTEFKLNTEKLSINDYMKSISELLSEFCGSRKINLFKRTGNDTEVIIDSGKLFMAVFQLIDNACSVSKEGGKVFISSGTEGDYVQISVMDEGPGVPGELTESIFAAGFSESKGRNRFGLPIAKRIVNLHSGEISFSNNSNAGCTFTIRIPVFDKASDKLPNNASESDSTSENLKTV